MPKPPRPWIVTRHDPIEKVEDNLWTVEGDVPGVPIKRRMFIVRRSDGTLLFFGCAIPLEEALLAEIAAWGRPSILVVTHDQHMIDARPFAERLKLRLYGPKQCEAKIRQRAEMAGVLEDVPKDAAVEIVPVSGAKTGEPAAIVRSAGGQRVTLLFSDAIQNNAKESIGLILRLCGFAGGPKVVPLFKMLFTKDKAALRRQISEWADLPGLARLMFCHGNAVAEGAAAALRSAAAGI
jgi:hypothetical protein